MGIIEVLDKTTIDKIAAGEVVERPASVVKELVENAMDAKSTMITVELKEGGIGLIRITDNGVGIAADDIKVAFFRHATSKIRRVEDLLSAGSLGFRGEALSSISSVAKVEMITKQKSSFVGSRYVIEGGEEITLEEAGCPDGTTFLIRDLFYNVPARRKFLKSATTESGYCAELMQRLALCRPDIAFKFISNGKIIFQTSGNNNLQDAIYQIFGRDIAFQMTKLCHEEAGISVNGFVGKPVIARGNRNYENFFLNGRYIRSSIISKAIEEAYRPYMMQHKYPFTVFQISMKLDAVDVNVHPSKLEVRFSDGEGVYYAVYHAVKDALAEKNMIPHVEFGREEKPKTEKQYVGTSNVVQQFEKNRLAEKASEYVVSKPSENNAEGVKPGVTEKSETEEKKSTENKPGVLRETEAGKRILSEDSSLSKNKAEITSEAKIGAEVTSLSKNKAEITSEAKNRAEAKSDTGYHTQLREEPEKTADTESEENTDETYEKPLNKEIINEKPQNKEITREIINEKPQTAIKKSEAEQMELPNLLAKGKKKEFRLIGQVFLTYWLVEMEGQLFMIDQHAAHEKILYEQTMARIRDKQPLTQQVAPPYVVSLSIREAETLELHGDVLRQLGYEFDSFGGRDYKIFGVPADLCGLTGADFFLQLLDELVAEKLSKNPQELLEKVASMSCKAAVKGNQTLSFEEARTLIDRLFTLDNPYHCPHGRPTTISMSKTEIEKKFKRIL